VSGVPSPDETFERAVEEGERRLDQSLLELVSLAVPVGVVTAGNLAGGLGLATLTHVTQVMGSREFRYDGNE